MPVNEFEKQVQLKMDELRLHPGEPVWENIEKEINKRKRRRVVFFILPIFAGLLLLGYGGYRYLLPSKKSNSIATIHDKEKENPISSEKPVESKESGTLKKSQQLPRSGGQGGLNPGGQVGQQTVVINEIVQPVPGENDVAVNEIRKLSNRIEPAAAYRMDELLLVSAKINGRPGNKATASEYPYSLPGLTKNKSNPSQQNKKRGSLAFAFSAGISDIWKNSISSAGQGSNSPVTGSPGYPGGNNPPLPRADFYSGPAFKAGLHWEKEFARRLTFVTGLNYAYYSAKSKVGGQTAATLQVYFSDLGSQSINNYYYGAPQESFMNRYHFVEIPAGIQWQVNKSQKLPVTLNIGGSLSRLIGTNAVIYDTARGGIYFHSNSLFNKTHINLNAGISISSGKWSVGPQWSMDLTENVRGGLDKSQYLFGAYLGFRYRISRK